MICHKCEYYQKDEHYCNLYKTKIDNEVILNCRRINYVPTRLSDVKDLDYVEESR